MSTPNPFGGVSTAQGTSAQATPEHAHGHHTQANGHAQVNGQSQISDAPQEVIDLNDPAFTSEVLVNTEGDAYAQPAPPPDGRYRAKLTLEGVKHDGSLTANQMWPGKSAGEVVPYLPKKHTNRSGVVDQMYAYTTIKAGIIDPSGKYDGINLFDSWVGTFQGRDGSTKIATILARLKKPDGSPWITPGMRINQTAWMELFVKALAGEPEIGVETMWEWSCQGCGEEAKAQGKQYPKSIQGMGKFPLDASKSKPGNPVYSPEMKCQIKPAHQFSRARATIARFIALGELK